MQSSVSSSALGSKSSSTSSSTYSSVPSKHRDLKRKTRKDEIMGYDLTKIEKRATECGKDSGGDYPGLQIRISRRCQPTQQIFEHLEDHKQPLMDRALSLGPRRTMREHLDFGFICREARGRSTKKAQRIRQRTSEENQRIKPKTKQAFGNSGKLQGHKISHLLISTLPNHPLKTFVTVKRLYGANRHIL